MRTLVILGLGAGLAAASPAHAGPPADAAARSWLAAVLGPDLDPAIAGAAPTFRYDLVGWTDCMKRYRRPGTTRTPAARRALFGCVHDTLSTYAIGDTWDATPIAQLPEKRHRRFVKAFGKRATAVVGNHAGGYVIVVLVPAADDTLAIAGLLVDETLGE